MWHLAFCCLGFFQCQMVIKIRNSRDSPCMMGWDAPKSTASCFHCYCLGGSLTPVVSSLSSLERFKNGEWGNRFMSLWSLRRRSSTEICSISAAWRGGSSVWTPNCTVAGPAHQASEPCGCDSYSRMQGPGVPEHSCCHFIP